MTLDWITEAFEALYLGAAGKAATTLRPRAFAAACRTL
jgi:hypothetical protein